MSILHELWLFIRERKKYWLVPVLVILLLFTGLFVLAQSSALAPFLYTFFLNRECASLGISAFYHDSAAALVDGGVIIAAAQEERFSRKKHDQSFPKQAAAWCLSDACARLRDIDFVVFYEKPFLKFERLLETYFAFAPRGVRSFAQSMPLWVGGKLFQKATLVRELKQLDDGFDPARLLFAEHHLSHAASAFFPSPFEQALVLTMDGVGEWATSSAGLGSGNNLEILREMHFPHSLGLLYSAFTAYCGFRVNSGEYKLMGLAPYGEPRYRQAILDHLIDLKPDGSFRLNLDYFDYCTGLRMTGEKFHRLFGGPPRRPDGPLDDRHRALAASVQQVLEEAVLRLTRSLAAETGARNLCLAGGVALNCVANGKILRDGRFDGLWIQPAAGDAGGAVGAALAAYHLYRRQPRAAPMRSALLGPSFSQAEIEQRLAARAARFQVLDEATLFETTAADLDAGRIVGWFQGRMEFGPRALGARSILADPRRPEMRDRLNEAVKMRETFRPFAPAVLLEETPHWFDLAVESPYMLLTAPVIRSGIPAVTHVDRSARVQTVDRETLPSLHALLSVFHRRTGCPVLVNTSFNVRGEPLVCTPEEAFRCFLGTALDRLAIGNCYLRKEDQTVAADPAYAGAFEPD